MTPSDFQHTRQGGVRSFNGVSQGTARQDTPSPQRRNDGRPDGAASHMDEELMPVNPESWVEVSSQPSSSSLSSIGDEIVTTGLRVGHPSYPTRRRRPQQQQPMPASFIVGHSATQGGATSSQEEYDETESEEDRVLTSSTEAIHPSANLLRNQTTVRASAVGNTDSDSDDDENATALGRPSNSPVFRPQPNAFSHPPSHLNHRHSTSAVPSYHHHSSPSRPAMQGRAHTRSHRGPPNYMSPAYQADNDAALRASLTTLLSCAAAARGIPKEDDRRGAAGVVPSSQPMELRLVPESELMADTPPPPAPTSAGPAAAAASKGGANKPLAQQARTASNSSAPSAAPSSSSGRSQQQQQDHQTQNPPTTHHPEKTKRAAATQSRQPARAAKKKRTSEPIITSVTETDHNNPSQQAFFTVSPTLLTWVVSAGVVVLVSVVGFGAGYVIGREVGRQEGVVSSSLSTGGGGGGGGGGLGFGAAGSNASACGSEMVRASGGGGVGAGGTLRRIRWGGVGKSVTA
ncbi:hypothetical protein N658DRAFT_496072 [Parathielavia hyrcaniae]|uniref:Uncharacterized protein n=1 Tax=Parathielavia hyrcaniae TaxID=113614 RepID=A0AAN6Q6G2_9PEZI|nr:hypothetical protein N658DRAFT_496072 [Parathielavia hyrcaniae]